MLKDTNKQVEYTSREENLHAMIGIKIINTIRQEYPELFDAELKAKILFESQEAVKYECEIIDWIVNGYDHEHLNANLLKEFIKNRLNESLRQIGYYDIFDTEQNLLSKTIWFDEQVLGNNMTDFFHSRPVEYAKKALVFDAEALFEI
jgi:ribonucleoside-diphosphate reductase beta chain